MTPVNTRDLPLLELLAAAPQRVIPAEKVEPMALILLAKGLLQTGDYLDYASANGRPPAPPQLREAFRSAAAYRCTFLSRDSYGLSQDGGLYLQDLGVIPGGDARRMVAALLARELDELLREAEELLRV